MNFTYTGPRKESRKDGRLLLDHILQPQDDLWQQETHRRRYYRKSSKLPYLRGSQHTHQYFQVRSGVYIGVVVNEHYDMMRTSYF